jgi:hypothetical protein
VRGLAARVAGDEHEATFRPALVEIEEALSPGFIIEELQDGRYTVLVPSVAPPAAGSLFILPRERVHPVNVPFTSVVKVISKWGRGRRRTGAWRAQPGLTVSDPLAVATHIVTPSRGKHRSDAGWAKAMPPNIRHPILVLSTGILCPRARQRCSRRRSTTYPSWTLLLSLAERSRDHECWCGRCAAAA